MKPSNACFIGDPFPWMAEKIPEGTLGEAKIEHFTVSKTDSVLTSFQAFGPRRDEFVPPGSYTRLLIGNTLMMTDTPMERRSNTEVFIMLMGKC